MTMKDDLTVIHGVQRILFLRSVVLDFVISDLFALVLLCVTSARCGDCISPLLTAYNIWKPCLKYE